MVGYRGRDKASAWPTLVLECLDRKVGAAAKAIISRDKLWEDTVREYPGIRLAHRARAPQLCAGAKDTSSWEKYITQPPGRERKGLPPGLHATGIRELVV